MSAEDHLNNEQVDNEQVDENEITEEEIALLMEHGDLTPELQELIQHYQSVTTPKSPAYSIGSQVAITFSFDKYDLLLLPAIILSYSADVSSATVLILTPITLDTVPCTEYFRNNKQCEGCSVSHGYDIPIDRILPYEALEEIQIDHLQYGKKVWCQGPGEEIWRLGNIIDQLHGPRWRIRLKDKGRKRLVVDLEHIKPFQSLGDDHNSDSDEREEWSESDSGTEYADEEILRSNSRIARDFGSWQEHTTGFGSKMMKKMGYVEGQGLGLNGEGRVDPVEAHLGQQGVNNHPGLGLRRKSKKKTKRGTTSSNTEQTAEEETKSAALTLMDSLLETNTNKEDTSGEEVKDKVINKVNLNNKQETSKTLSKLQEDLDNAQKEYIHAKEAYRRNSRSPMEKQFSAKLKAATAQLEKAKKQFNQVSNYVKQEKQKKDMYTF